MTQIEITNELRGDLGELYFKHLCQQRDYAFIRLEDIQSSKSKRVLEFKSGFDRIPVRLPFPALSEIKRVSEPTIVDGNPAYVFDFLTCKLYFDDVLEAPNNKELDDFTWVEIKTGKSLLSRHQVEVARTCKMRFAIFRVQNVDASPWKVEIDWEYDSWK